MARLSTEDIEKELEKLPGWRHDEGELHKQFKFPTFMDAIAFIDRVAVRADAMNHHPDLENSYTRVRVGLSTWSESGVTQKDIRLAHEIEAVTGGNLDRPDDTGDAKADPSR